MLALVLVWVQGRVRVRGRQGLMLRWPLRLRLMVLLPVPPLVHPQGTVAAAPVLGARVPPVVGMGKPLAVPV
jgi:hypothetical protein